MRAPDVAVLCSSAEARKAARKAVTLVSSGVRFADLRVPKARILLDCFGIWYRDVSGAL